MIQPALPDIDLVRRLVAGSESALATLYDRHATALFRVALRVTGDPGEAEEVVSETFLVLWDRAEAFDPERGELGAWLGRIARNRAIDRRRAAMRHAAAQPFAVVSAGMPDEAAAVDWLLTAARPVALAEPEPAPDAHAIAAETRAVVHDAIDDLPDDERVPIVLAYREGLSQSEIAERLGWPLGTVKTRSRRALRRLRDRLEGAVLDDGPTAARDTPSPSHTVVAGTEGPARPARDPARVRSA